MKQKSLLLVVLSLILASTSPNPSPMRISPNQKYTQTDRYTINTDKTYGPTPLAWSPYNYVLHYPPQITNIQMAVLSIDQLSIAIVNNTIKLNTNISSINSTMLTVSIFSASANTIEKLGIRVYLASWLYAESPIFVSYEVSIHPQTNLSKSINYTLDLDNLQDPVAIVKSISIFYTLIGFHLANTDTANIMDIYLQLSYMNSTSAKIILGSKSTTPTYVQTIRFTLIAFDAYMVNLGIGNFKVYSSTVLPLNNQTEYTTSQKNLYEFNTLCGITGLSITSNSSLTFSLAIPQPETLLFKTNNNFTYFSYNYLIIQTNYCKFSSPYLSPELNVCYDSCPDGYYSDMLELTCKLCQGRCATCNGSVGCLSCKVGYQLDSSYQCQIKPIPLPAETSVVQKSSNLSLVSSKPQPPKNLDNVGIANDPKTIKTSNSTPQKQQSNNQKNPPKTSSNTTIVIQSQNYSTKPTIILVIVMSIAILLLSAYILYFKVIKNYCLNKYRVENENKGQKSHQLIVESHLKLESVKIETDELRAIQAVQNREYITPEVWLQMLGQEYVPREKCPIDMAPDMAPDAHLRLQCGHFFHYPCIMQQKWRSGRCPVCQRAISNQGMLHCQDCKYRYKVVNLNVKAIDFERLNDAREKYCNQCIVRHR